MKRFFAILMILCCIAAAGCATAQDDADVRLIALNVGKGDCLLLLIGEDAFLIDSGYDYTFNRLHEALAQYSVSRLRGVFLSHCDKDHYGGLMALAQSDLPVDAWYAAAIYYDIPKEGHPLELAAAQRNESVRYLNAGDTLSLTESVTLCVVGPLTCNTDNENNNSLVFYVDTDQGSLLFTGDMKLEEEYELLTAGAFVHADLLKVPFHGDNTASSQSFVDAVLPAAALISTSTAQEPDTPASSILKRYGKAGAELYVTQDYQWGVALTLKNGQVSGQAIQWETPDYSGSVQAAIDMSDDLLTLYNRSGEDISLDGWIVYSTRGEECLTLPEDALLPAGGAYSIGSRATGGQADLKIDIKRVWHKSKLDQCLVFDTAGGLAAFTDNGMAE
ncbi:MAG: MBL fold metallo-hydrolase [Clostridia bacterium]|nr:MBL fold metallo-hydrolase [Clostridia bacterium]